MAEELVISDTAPAVRCSYCGLIYPDELKQEMGFETDKWAICFKCFKQVCDKAGGG